MEEVVKYSASNQIATITLNRPEKYNTLRGNVIAGLEQALQRANTDEDVKVIGLEGASDAFCGGIDFSADGFGLRALWYAIFADLGVSLERHVAEADRQSGP